MRRSTLIAAVLLGFAASALAQEKVTFGRNYEPGTYVTNVKIKSDQQISGPSETKMGSDMAMTMEMTVDKATDKGQMFHLMFRRFQMKVTGPQEISYDSAQAGENDNNPISAKFKELLDKKIDVTLDDKGALSKIEGLEMPGLDNMVKSSLGIDTRHLPDKAVAVGDHWDTTVKQDIPMIGAVNLKMTSTLRKVEKSDSRQVAVVDVEGRMEKADKTGKPAGDDADKSSKIDMKLKGTMKVDVASGRPLESKIDMDMDVSMSVPAPGQEKPVSMSLKNKSNVDMTTKEGKYEAPKTTPQEK
jgi:hypothetical protein